MNKKILEQIIRFGAVGILSFMVDFAIYSVLCNLFKVPYLVAGFFGFSISLIFNYVMSMHFVFERREDISREKEFIIFAGMSAVGLIINEIILYLCIDGIYAHWHWLSSIIPISLAKMGAKVAATGVVMVYNFVSRKIVLEKK